MKSLLIITAAVNFLLYTCDKKRETSRIRGKLVHISCASAVIQVLDSAYYHLGQDRWQQATSKPVYEHVFAVENLCGFRNKPVKEGEEFYFRLTETEDKDCVVCMLWDNPPSVKRKIVVVSE